MHYEIAVVVINYDSSKYTIDCIKSLRTQTSKEVSLQIVIVDNASQFEDFQVLKESISQFGTHVQLIRSRINTGFGGGNIMGAGYCNADYIAFENNDTIFQNDCLTLLREFMEATPETGFLCTSIKQIANALEEFRYNPEFCHQYAIENFNSMKMATDNLKLYRKVLNGEYLNNNPIFLAEKNEVNHLV